ncbi:MAG: hypothetical protein Q9168_004649 [Polycauliona sp. 1 TL-2023]
MPVFGPFTPSANPPTNAVPPIVLQVGEQRFYVSESSLSGSPFLAAKVSERWESDKQPDGSYFIDADPQIFNHVLRFLRHGVYPLCFSKASGHDYATYAAIQKQADYFGIQKLVDWLQKKRYVNAITYETRAKTVDGEEGLANRDNHEVETQYFPTWKTVKNYVCPRGFAKHYGDASACGKSCLKARGDAEEEYEEVQDLTTLTITKRTVFNQLACVVDVGELPAGPNVNDQGWGW